MGQQATTTAAGEQLWRLRLAEQASRNGRLFFRLAYGVLRDVSMAEDVCQQAMLKAWEHRQSIRDERSLRAWLARTVVNESLQIVRRQKIESSALREQAMSRPACAVADHSGDAREGVLLALARLPETMRLIVALRIMDGVSGNEVKEMLGCSAAEVSRQLHRGMNRLRELLGEWRVRGGGVAVTGAAGEDRR